MENPLHDLDGVLAADYLDGLGTLSVSELRRRKAQCDEIEVALSYLRRLVQGRLDIVHAELQRRADGEAGDLSGIVRQLPEILSGDSVPADGSRFPHPLDPEVSLRTLTAELDRIIDVDRLGALPEMGDDQVRSVADDLAQLERRVSTRRRSVHERLDALQAELVRRYRSGEATVDALLR